LQLRSIRGIVDELDQSIWGLRNDSPEDQARKSQALAADLRTRLEKVLSEGQRDRLAEITIQSRGAASALEPQAAERLALTADQRERIEAAMEKTQHALQALETLAPRGQTQEQIDRLARRIRQAERNDLREILNQHQEQEWAALAGTPFDFSRVKPFLFRA